jgi:hypothetical protein
MTSPAIDEPLDRVGNNAETTYHPVGTRKTRMRLPLPIAC